MIIAQEVYFGTESLANKGQPSALQAGQRRASLNWHVRLQSTQPRVFDGTTWKVKKK